MKQRQKFSNLFEAIRLSHDDGRFQTHGPPPFATQARPGSQAKIRVLIARIEAGVDLHHPDDLTCRLDRYEELLTRLEEEPYRVHWADSLVESVCTDPWNEG